MVIFSTGFFKTPPKKNKIKILTIFFFGTLYSLIKKNGRLSLKLHFSYNLFINMPQNINYFTFRKRLVIFGSAKYLNNFLSGLKNLRIPNIYTGTGLRQRGNNYIIKPGKIRKR